MAPRAHVRGAFLLPPWGGVQPGVADGPLRVTSACEPVTLPAHTMAKSRTIYSCSACGAQAAQWAGQCGDCGGWNTLSEIVAAVAPVAGRFAGYSGKATAGVVSLAAVPSSTQIRTSVGMQELDRVLGGGLVAGSVVLIGGDPGIGITVTGEP